jgi:hypothetical protein
MRGLVVSVSVVVLGLLAGCSSPPRPSVAPIAASPDDDGSPVVVDEREPRNLEEVPKSIRRLVAEERVKVNDCVRLSAIVGDDRGRVRARNEAFGALNELQTIETSLEGADSDRLDDLVVRLRRLSTRVSLLHDALEASL